MILLLLISCATTPKQKQLLTIETFNGLYKGYLDEYDRQPLSVQVEWKKDVDPHWKTASDAIKAYVKLKDPMSPEALEKAELYKMARDTALDLLLKYGVEIKEK